MGQRITTFSDGSYLEYDQGSFDAWCVYLTRPNAQRYAPKDYQYFERLLALADRYGRDRIYRDFCTIYERTGKTIEEQVLDLIKQLGSRYDDPADALNISIDFTIMYMGMIAEENKAHAILGKRVKRLGIYQVLYDGLSPMEAAFFSRGKKWRGLDALCKLKGF